MAPQEYAPPPKHNKVELIPWDPNSAAHFQRLYEQRVACTWDQHLVGEWKAKVLEGNKFLYWIKLSDDLEGRDELLARHAEIHPKEKDALTDTASILANAPRTPTHAAFVPIGHIALDLYPDRNEQFSLPPSTVWIKSLYISWAIQAGGFGRSAMVQIERLAALPPLNATAMALDTVTKEYQTTPESKAIFHRISGGLMKQLRANEEWYTRQGYEAIARIDGLYTWVSPDTGEELAVPSVFLKKDIV